MRNLIDFFMNYTETLGTTIVEPLWKDVERVEMSRLRPDDKRKSPKDTLSTTRSRMPSH